MRSARFVQVKILLGLLFFCDGNNLTALIVTAIGANSMRGAHFAAIGTRYQVHRREGVVGAATVAPSARMFSFWLRNHDSLLNSFTIPMNDQKYSADTFFRKIAAQLYFLKGVKSRFRGSKKGRGNFVAISYRRFTPVLSTVVP